MLDGGGGLLNDPVAVADFAVGIAGSAGRTGGVPGDLVDGSCHLVDGGGHLLGLGGLDANLLIVAAGGGRQLGGGERQRFRRSSHL